MRIWAELGAEIWLPRFTAMNNRFRVLCSVFATLLFVMAASSFIAAQAPAHHLVKFDVSGAGTGTGQGTSPFLILNDGTILGQYIDSGNVVHGFLRSAAGAITPFDAPGAGTGSGQGTYPQAANSTLTVVGYYSDSNGVYHGFIRSPGGAYTKLDDPRAGTASGQGTFPGNINKNGLIAGIYTDSNGVFHGFLRSPGGGLDTFDDPSAGTGASQGTGPAGTSGLADTGWIAGSYTDSSNVSHGFLRSPAGAFTTIDPVGSTA